ncbi:MAG: WD40/YVTN/BNR-like repeat-containing protein [Mucilaginibacter sp.]
MAAYAQHVELLQHGQRTSIRGLSVVDDSVAWISGSRGTIATTHNGGKTWAWQQIKGYEKADFRDIEAFSDKKAIIMSSGTPALILKTTDGGVTWHEKYRNVDSVYFLDAMDFDNPKHGIVLGDPIKNKFLLLETNDAGESWHIFKNLPDAIIGEAAFAASGTCVRLNSGEIHIVTGGTSARHLEFEPSAKKWFVYNLPIAQGQSSKGAFSISTNYNSVVVGGNYAKDKIADSVSCVFNSDIKAKYKLSQKGPDGFQSCIEAISENNYLSTGTSGSNFSTDGGLNWIKIDAISYNVCRKAKKGNLILLAGDGGKIGVLKPL